MDRRRIPKKMKRRQNSDRLSALKIADIYQKRLMTARTKAIQAALKMSKSSPVETWPEVISGAVREPYLSPMLSAMMRQTGKIGGRAIMEQFTARPKADKDLWEMTFEQWVSGHVGEEITTIEETLREWLRERVAEVMDDAGSWGVEKATRALYANVRGQWPDAAEWMCRRIVRTETMNSLAVSANECVQSLGVDVVKIWSCSGLRNTRDTHLAMEGKSVGMTDVFEVPNADGGTDMMRFPHDGTMGASAGNIINCACDCLYLPKD